MQSDTVPNGATSCWHATLPSAAPAENVEKPKIIKMPAQRKKLDIQRKINQVTKHIEIPQSQHTDKVVDVPLVAQSLVPTFQTAQKAVEVPQV